MAGIDLGQELIFHEAGTGFLETVSGKFVEIIYGQEMKADFKATTVDVEGGSSLFPIYTYISKKEGTIEINSATFSLAQTGISQSVEYTTTGNLKNNRIVATNATTTLGADLTGVTNVRCIGADGTKLTVTQSGTADTNGVDVSATGTVTWGTGVAAGEYVFWFQSIAAIATKAGMLKNAMPEVCSFSWSLIAEDLDGSKYQVDVYAKRVRADGSFTIDAKRSTASVPKISMKVLDPGDGTDDFATITVSKLA